MFTGTEPGSFVMQVTATDEDLDPVLQYHFAPGGNYNDQFSIDPYSGKISVAKPLDYELTRAYKLKVQVHDKNHTVATEVILNVTDENDNAPRFTQQSYQVNLCLSAILCSCFCYFCWDVTVFYAWVCKPFYSWV